MTDSYAGFQKPDDSGSDLGSQLFVIRSLLSKLWTATLVSVNSVTNNGGVAPTGMVSVIPLVNQINGIGTATPHGIIYNIPYCRVQGNGNAIIIDPEVGDIGVAVFASRDISGVKKNKTRSNPGSFRTFDPADGIYLFSVLGAAPTQYIQFNDDGITILSPTQITLQVGGKSLVIDESGITLDGILWDSHTHEDPQGGQVGPPINS